MQTFATYKCISNCQFLLLDKYFKENGRNKYQLRSPNFIFLYSHSFHVSIFSILYIHLSETFYIFMQLYTFPNWKVEKQKEQYY